MTVAHRTQPGRDLPPAVLFDLDDTIFDHALTSRAALARVRSGSAYLRRLPLDRIWREYGRLLEEAQPDVLSGRITVDASRIERFRRLAALAGEIIPASTAGELSRAYRAEYLLQRRAVPGARRLLQRLHGRTAIGVVTNNAQAEQTQKLAYLGLSGLVDELVVSEAVGIAKPDPRIFQLALRRVGAGPAEAVMVGDSWANDVRGARAAGIRAIWFNRFGATAPEPVPVAQLSSYRAPARAERLLRATD